MCMIFRVHLSARQMLDHSVGFDLYANRPPSLLPSPTIKKRKSLRVCAELDVGLYVCVFFPVSLR